MNELKNEYFKYLYQDVAVPSFSRMQKSLQLLHMWQSHQLKNSSIIVYGEALLTSV